MVGQSTLIRQLKETTAPFVILVGPKGSGRKQVIRELFKDKLYELPDVKVETVRKMIEDAYTVRQELVYLVPDADNMSLAAKNALLKLTEEPPQNARVVMTLEQQENTLTTILSRAQVYFMQPYSTPEMLRFIPQDTPEQLREIILETCFVPGEVTEALNFGSSLWEFVNKVVDNVHKVGGANALKICEKINIKADTEEGKFPLRLFFRVFELCCMRRAVEIPGGLNEKYLQGVVITSGSIAKLRIVGVNKQILFDDWLFRIREAWR